MLKSLLRGLAELLFTAAAVALVVATTLLVFGSWLITKSPRDKKVKAMVNLATAGLSTVQAFRKQLEQ